MAFALAMIAASCSSPDGRLPAPSFELPWNATFAQDAGGLVTAWQPGAELRTIRFPGTADGDLQLEGWVKERLVGAAASSKAEVVGGRVVYTGAKHGVDRIYEVSPERVEEFLRIADEGALSELFFEVETGPAIADLVADGSGFGLVAVDASGRPVLKAPQPVGVDARGAAIEGRLVAARAGEHHFTIRVELRGAVTFPVLLDPSWVSTAAMAIGRADHTATLLLTGKVLVAGGVAGLSAELYDPVTGAWSATGSLVVAHTFHTATLLPNGKVLLAAGNGLSVVCELYDPATGTWSATGSLAIGRERHTATLLLNGKVLVTGGSGNSGLLASTEIYDPAVGTWTTTGAMTNGRYLHAASLLPNGKVLVSGGPGGISGAELFSPATGAWSVTGNLTTTRYFHTQTTLPNGKALVAGGGTGAELYDPATGTWSATAPMVATRSNHTETLLNGKVLLAGGDSLSSAELFDPVAGTFSATGSLSTVRTSHTATLLPNGKVLVTGGSTVGSPLASAELYPFEALGGPCTLPGDCLSGFCVDGVCCNTACGGTVSADCQACNVDAGAPSTGTCGLVGSVHVCRPSASACDLTESCTGASPACPVDLFQPPPASCSGYLCSGTAGTCPVGCTTSGQCVSPLTCEGSQCLSPTDAGSSDAGTSDAGNDAGSVDAGSADAGEDDAGPGNDAGPGARQVPWTLGVGCGCSSPPVGAPPGLLMLWLVALARGRARGRPGTGSRIAVGPFRGRGSGGAGARCSSRRSARLPRRHGRGVRRPSVSSALKTNAGATEPA